MSDEKPCCEKPKHTCTKDSPNPYTSNACVTHPDAHPDGEDGRGHTIYKCPHCKQRFAQGRTVTP